MRPLVTHQAGRKHLERLKNNYAEAGVEGELVVFIENIAVQYADCDLVICRAGALTIAELNCCGYSEYFSTFSLRSGRSSN